MHQPVCGRQQSETSIGGPCHNLCTPARDVSADANGLNAGMLGLERADLVKACSPWWGESLKGWAGGALQPGIFMEEAWDAIEAKCHCSEASKG